MSYHPKGSEPQCFASHTLCGVFNAGGPCRWREVGRIRKYWGGNAGSRTTVNTCLSWAVLAYSLCHRPAGGTWMVTDRPVDLSDEPNAESRMVRSQPGFPKRPKGRHFHLTQLGCAEKLGAEHRPSACGTVRRQVVAGMWLPPPSSLWATLSSCHPCCRSLSHVCSSICSVRSHRKWFWSD